MILMQETPLRQCCLPRERARGASCGSGDGKTGRELNHRYAQISWSSGAAAPRDMNASGNERGERKGTEHGLGGWAGLLMGLCGGARGAGKKGRSEPRITRMRTDGRANQGQSLLQTLNMQNHGSSRCAQGANGASGAVLERRENATKPREGFSARGQIDSSFR